MTLKVTSVLLTSCCTTHLIGEKLNDEGKEIILLTSVKASHPQLFQYNVVWERYDYLRVGEVSLVLYLEDEKKDEAKYEAQALVVRNKKNKNR